MGLHMKCVLLLVVVATLAICADGRPKPEPKFKNYDDSYKKKSKKQNYYEDHDDHYDDDDDHYDYDDHDDCYDDHDDYDDCHDDHDYHYEDNKCNNYKKPPPPPPPKKCKQDYNYGCKQKQYGGCGNSGGYKNSCDDDCGCNSGSKGGNYGKKNSNYGKKGFKKY